MFKKGVYILVFLICMCALCSCSLVGTEEEKTTGEPSMDASAKKLKQFSEIKTGETIAEICVRDYGSIYIRFFSEEAPKAVENFITLAKDGYYNGCSIYSVVKDYCIQGGIPDDSDGTATIYGELFENEVNENLRPFRGALCMANNGTSDSNACEFFIIQANAGTIANLKELLDFKGYTLAEYLKAGYGCKLTESELVDYYTYGGAPWLYGHHTVFGQVYDGFEVLDSIADTEVTDGIEYKPVDDIIIDYIKCTSFE